MSSYLVEFEAQSMVTIKNGKMTENSYKVCTCCSRLSDVEHMTHTESKSICHRCIQADLDWIDEIKYRS